MPANRIAAARPEGYFPREARYEEHVEEGGAGFAARLAQATAGALSATGWSPQFQSFRRMADPGVPIAGFANAMPAYCHRCEFGLTHPSCGLACATTIGRSPKPSVTAFRATFGSEGLMLGTNSDGCVRSA